VLFRNSVKTKAALFASGFRASIAMKIIMKNPTWKARIAFWMYGKMRLPHRLNAIATRVMPQ
jgi:hypothetical protein